MSAGCAYDPGRRVAFRVFGIGMVKSSKATARAHLIIIHISCGRVADNENRPLVDRYIEEETRGKVPTRQDTRTPDPALDPSCNLKSASS